MPSSVLLLHASADNGAGIGFEQQNFLPGVDDDEIEIQRAESRRHDLHGPGAVGFLRICACNRPGVDIRPVHIECSRTRDDVSVTVQRDLKDVGDRTGVREFPDQICRESRFLPSEAAGDSPLCQGKARGGRAAIGVDYLRALLAVVNDKVVVRGAAARSNGDAAGTILGNRIGAGEVLRLDYSVLTHCLGSLSDDAIAIGRELTDRCANEESPHPVEGRVGAGGGGCGTGRDHFADKPLRLNTLQGQFR